MTSMDLNAIRRQARTAGFLYLTVAVTAPIGVTYIPGKLDRLHRLWLVIWGARPAVQPLPV